MRIIGLTAASLASLSAVMASRNERTSLKESFVESLQSQSVLMKLGEAHRRLALERPTPTFLNQHRRFGNVKGAIDRTILEEYTVLQQSGDLQKTCDAAFMDCLKSQECTMCFSSLETEGIDWASVTPETPCKDVSTFLFDGGHCVSLKGKPEDIDIFCSTFDSCVVWDDDNDSRNNSGGNSTDIDCDSLTECQWEGFHSSFIGDGICHEGMDGCYNSKVCGYDGGDCCEDTCDHGNSQYMKCGMDNYACRDPASQDCDPRLSLECTDTGDDDKFPRPSDVKCVSNQVPYRLVLYDSFGDGWDGTSLTLKPRDDSSKIIFNGGLKEGAQGTEYVCLAMDPTCYHVDVSGGMWGNEVSWAIKPMGEGTKALADGGSPMSCEFSVAGAVCERTCEGKPNKNPNDDPNYKTYKDMYNCMQKVCVIQVGACQQDPSCAPCFGEDAPEFCFANDKFNAVIDCGVCRCSGKEGETSEFCQKKATPGAVIPPPTGPGAPFSPRPCSAEETLKGSSAVMTFAHCSNFDEVSMMITDFDENNFGALDTFEACAHSYQNENLHGGRTALGCMQILANAMKDPSSPDGEDGIPKEAVAALAGFLYHNAEDFCECASKASAECPLCPSFKRFKTLLYETLDACKALDEIDCDAWNEFYTPCKNNLVQMFGSADFTNPAQCTYVADSCGGAGPFPAFRKLDCNREIPKSAWDFYSMYAHSCVKDNSPQTPATPSPVAPPVAPLPAPTGQATANPVPVKPNDNNRNSDSGGGGSSKPYVPKDDKSNKPYKPKKKHKFLKLLLLLGVVGGAAYWYHKRRSEFQFVRYRRARNYGGGESEMYTGLSMESSTSFEPPSLPPTPSAMDGFA